jgi:hypothetical protein
MSDTRNRVEGFRLSHCRFQGRASGRFARLVFFNSAILGQDQKRTNDGLATAAAVVIFWPAAFFVGGDKQTAAELAQMKGQMVAIEQEANMKKCGIQFQGPRPPGT